MNDRMLRKVGRQSAAAFLRPHRDMDANEIQVNCGRCGKSMIVRVAALYGKRLVDCVDCERRVQPRDWPRLVRDKNPDPAV
jgi:hypothetical protein